MNVRIGNGFDVHALVAGRKLVLGGVDVPFDRGLDGHSDADVLLHALADAILGALAMGDIGTHFPDTEIRWKGADSRALLRHVVGSPQPPAGASAISTSPSSRRRRRSRPSCRRCARTSRPTRVARSMP